MSVSVSEGCRSLGMAATEYVKGATADSKTALSACKTKAQVREPKKKQENLACWVAPNAQDGIRHNLLEFDPTWPSS